MVATVEDVLRFWIDDVGEQGWYQPSRDLDDEIRQRFRTTWDAARDRALCPWIRSSEGTLALLIVTDQFPRNMFRDSPHAFSTDRFALTIAQKGIRRGDDLMAPTPQRQFFYLPMMHAESLSFQERGLRQFLLKMPEAESNILHARAHRDVIRRFGRFPHRNAALGRVSTPSEVSFLDAGGYGATVRDLQQAA